MEVHAPHRIVALKRAMAGCILVDTMHPGTTLASV
jgi:hypothetical protein